MYAQQSNLLSSSFVNLFIYLGFYVAFNTVQVISLRVVGRAAEPVHTLRQASALLAADQRQATTSFPTWGRAGNWTPASEVGGESVTTLPLWPSSSSVKKLS